MLSRPRSFVLVLFLATILSELPSKLFAADKQNSEGIRSAKNAVANLETAKELKTTLFASEPILKSPSNIDIDHLGRVWVCEVVNYRHFRNKNNPVREAGDRILILEDTNGDGRADKTTVFYQGRDIDSAHGVCVLPTATGKNTKAIVSAGSNVFIFTDKDGDGKADQKEVLFTGIGGVQHDHGIHAFVFGPDGRLYFNFGNEGRQIRDKNGKPIVDRAGNTVVANRKPYQEGMVFRCKLDGSNFETLGWNFRNNWEISVDSFGTLWQSDNDDDGNRGVRINFVMEFGNYGYKDELTGAGWRTPRTGMHAEIPKRHWHLNDPGVVPNLLQTYAGSPTGMCIYEGTLLPKRFHNEIIHSDAGPNVVRSYAVEKYGAGYRASINPILTGARDKWFRPSDVCIAPDGSLFVADWYDPGVGGHAQGDVTRGRIFRVAPPGAKYKVPRHDFTTTRGLIAALKSPNLATRYIAWQGLHQLGAQAEEPLKQVFENEKNPRFRARALWILGNIEVCGQHYVERAITDKNPNIRIQALRLARQIKMDVIPLIRQLVDDDSPAVRRECAISLTDSQSREVPKLWTRLAQKHDGQDRWYLEALGIAARGRWDACFTKWEKTVGKQWNTPAGRDIVWRSRSVKSIPYLKDIILSGQTADDELPRYFRAFDFHQSTKPKDRKLKQQTLAEIVVSSQNREQITSYALDRLGSELPTLMKRPKFRAAVEAALKKSEGTSAFLRLVGKMNLAERYPEVLAMAQKHPDNQLGVDAIRLLLEKKQFPLIRKTFQGKDIKQQLATVQVLGNSGDGRANGILRSLIANKKMSLEIRREAVRAFAKSRNGALELARTASTGKLDSSLKQAVAASLHGVRWRDIKQQADKLFPLPPSKSAKPLPPLAELLKQRGNPVRGRVVFNSVGTCAKCHKLNGFGKDVGPDLSEIGKKLSRRAMYESILYPSAGISHNYESYVIALDNGNTVTGLITSRTPDSVTVKGADAISRTFKMENVELIRKQEISLMPADLQKLITVQELTDVVEFLMTLKKKSNAATKKKSAGTSG
ncbi:MAG: hypothetical protein Tsb009_00820 [Planctomycetaceae bacterium]